MAHALARDAVRLRRRPLRASASARPATSPPPSRPSPSGSRAASGPSPPASSTPARTSAPSSRPLVVPVAGAHTGAGSAAFVVTGADRLRLGVLLVAALSTRRRSIRDSRPAELALHPRAIPPEPATPSPLARACSRHRQTWAFALGKFLTDPVWWFYLFWFPMFLTSTFGFDLQQASGCRSVTIYLLADVGSIGGGWLSSRLLKRGWTRERARARPPC